MAGISKKRIKTKNGEVIKYTISYYDVFGKQHTSGIYDTIKEAKRDLFWYPMTGPFWMGVLTIFCPSTRPTSKSAGVIFPPGMKTSSGRMPLNSPKTKS